MKGSNYILTTGWSRRITMFLDDEDEYYLYPAHVWPEPNQPPWHTDDILSMTYLPPNILATGSVDGEIVLCNLLSGHLLHRLRPFDDDDIKSNPSVDKGKRKRGKI